MDILFLCTLWGTDYLPIDDFFSKVKDSGYDGVDMWLPETLAERKKLIRLLEEYRFSIVAHQHQAKGSNIKEYCRSYEYYLNLSAECDPILINSHSGRDYFSLDDQLRVIDTAQEFSVKKNIRIAHETHRGRIGFSPYNAKDIFERRPDFRINADISHWVCVTESYLENCSEILEEAIKRTEHIHARVGYPEGPQIPDPRHPAWQDAVQFFLKLWSKIVEHHRAKGANSLTITPEFGPPPYMWTNLENNQPLLDQWAINVFIKDLLIKNFRSGQ